MGSSTEAPVLAALEQAEMAARERRLVASAEAERSAAVAQDRVLEISARADRRIDDAIDELRRDAATQADAAIEVLEREAAERTRARARSPDGDPAFERAVALVVAQVLGESATDDGTEGQA